MLRPLPRSTLFPYTTLFRSSSCCWNCWCSISCPPRRLESRAMQRQPTRPPQELHTRVLTLTSPPAASDGRFISKRRHFRLCRSEEHTSELQSRRDLVCRLLL